MVAVTTLNRMEAYKKPSKNPTLFIMVVESDSLISEQQTAIVITTQIGSASHGKDRLQQYGIAKSQRLTKIHPISDWAFPPSSTPYTQT
jgi:hypothetical protein